MGRFSTLTATEWPTQSSKLPAAMLAATVLASVLASSGAISDSFSAAAAWKRQPCGAAPGGVPGGADIVTRWGATVDPAKAAPLPEHPRPQMVRNGTVWNLNGMWEWEPASGVNGSASGRPPFGQTLARSILVPFPAESCLSGIAESHEYQWYRRTLACGADADAPAPAPDVCQGAAVLHFGAVDWHAQVYLNGRLLGNHSGGYDGFSFVLESGTLLPGDNELLIFVFDPSEHGAQPFGKQRAASIAAPGTDGEKYTPTSGIWQTVWLEHVPPTFISDLAISANLSTVTVIVSLAGVGLTHDTAITFSASAESAPGQVVATAHAAGPRGGAIVELSMAIPNPKLWSPSSPFLYNLTASIGWKTGEGAGLALGTDTVHAYFGMRTVTLGATPSGRKSLHLNGKPFFASGWLDQSWWPDGQYTAPTDDALAFDLQALKTFGMNMVRLHQKINPERWFYHADRLGVIVMQDMVQHFNYHVDASGETNNVPVDTTQFEAEWAAAICGRRNHPSIIQWNIFNEFEYDGGFQRWHCNTTSCPILEMTRKLDPTRLVDFNSGGPGNSLGIGDVNDIHSYPSPNTQKGSATATRYGMVGEYGGIGWAAPGHEWLPGMCQHRSAGNYNTSAAGAAVLLRELEVIAEGKASGNISAVVYTQITDVELECDGMYTYDRISHYDAADATMIKAANLKLTTMDG